MSNAITITVHGISGDYYPAAGDSVTNHLLWIDESNGLVFYLGSTLSKSVMLHIADSIELYKPPK